MLKERPLHTKREITALLNLIMGSLPGKRPNKKWKPVYFNSWDGNLQSISFCPPTQENLSTSFIIKLNFKNIAAIMLQRKNYRSVLDLYGCDYGSIIPWKVTDDGDSQYTLTTIQHIELVLVRESPCTDRFHTSHFNAHEWARNHNKKWLCVFSAVNYNTFYMHVMNYLQCWKTLNFSTKEEEKKL